MNLSVRIRRNLMMCIRAVTMITAMPALISSMQRWRQPEIIIFSPARWMERNEVFPSLATPDANGSYTGSYYYMTAMNFCVSDAVSRDPKLVACNAESLPGKSENLNLKKLSDLKDDSKMFLHGAPDSFLQSLTADVGSGWTKSHNA